MNNIIEFAVWAPNEEVFRQSWIDANILKNESGYNFTPEYSGIEITATQGWDGKIIKIDSEENITIIDGWHCNVRVTGQLVTEMTNGLQQYNEDGSLIDLFDRTWAKEIFSLIFKEKDEITKFPAGYRNTTGVTYCDINDINTPSCVRQ
jgi:hypothetical protein